MATKKALTFEQLLSRGLPRTTVEIGQFAIELQALANKDLDDIITRYPPSKDKDEPFGDGLRFELLSRCCTNVTLTIEDAKELFETWARPDVVKLQTALFDLNWVGSEAELVPLSETGSEGTGSSPSN